MPRLEIASVDAGRLTAWRHGSVEFDGNTLHKVIEEMNRFEKPLVLDDDRIRSHRISGRFRVGHCEAFVASPIRNATDARLPGIPPATSAISPIGMVVPELTSRV